MEKQRKIDIAEQARYISWGVGAAHQAKRWIPAQQKLIHPKLYSNQTCSNQETVTYDELPCAHHNADPPVS